MNKAMNGPSWRTVGVEMSYGRASLGNALIKGGKRGYRGNGMLYR